VEGFQTIGGSNGPKSKLFSFNVVFEPASTQEDIFQYSGIKKLIEMAAEGFNTTCFCYGQTGSGKTHTLTGPPGMVSFNKIIKINSLRNTTLCTALIKFNLVNIIFW